MIFFVCTIPDCNAVTFTNTPPLAASLLAGQDVGEFLKGGVGGGGGGGAAAGGDAPAAAAAAAPEPEPEEEEEEDMGFSLFD